MAEKELPSFRRPPVAETVLGVQFDRLAGFSNAHLGACWKYLAARPELATLIDARATLADSQPIPPVFEKFEDQGKWFAEAFTLQLTQVPESRLQIRSVRGDAMIQLQNGRLHYNWIGQRGTGYPRYTVVRPAFDLVYEAFRQFLRSEGLEDPRPNQWEITYANHIPKDTVWAQPVDWAKVLVGLPGVWAAPTAVRLESVEGTWHFEIPDRRGRLHVELRHAKLKQAGHDEIIRLTLTARGPVDQGASLGDGLDLGRRVIVSTFKDITSGDAHNYWGLES